MAHSKCKSAGKAIHSGCRRYPFGRSAIQLAHIAVIDLALELVVVVIIIVIVVAPNMLFLDGWTNSRFWAEELITCICYYDLAVELIIAVFVIVIVITGPLMLVQGGLICRCYYDTTATTPTNAETEAVIVQCPCEYECSMRRP